MDRYQRQKLLEFIGPAGQERLHESRVLLIGCGALGTVIADQLVRAGVGWLRICDRDVVEWSNLQRQVLFEEADARGGFPKASAAADRLAKINSQVAVEPRVADVHCGNIESLVMMDGRPVDLILDGTDNAQTRYLINDAAVKLDVPWIYGACVGTTGRVMGIWPECSACLRCIFPDPPGPGELPTCDTAGVLAAAAGVIASIQVVEAIKMLVVRGRDESPRSAALVSVDLWNLRFKTISTAESRRADCKTCGRRDFEFLDARPGSAATSLCGRDTIQIRPAGAVELDLKALKSRLDAAGQVEENRFFVRCALREKDEITLTVFCDGRAMIHGTDDPKVARSIYARYVGG